MLILIQGQRIRELLTWVEALTKLECRRAPCGAASAVSPTRGQPVEGGLKLAIMLTQETMVELIGITRQRVNQVMNRWLEDGIIRLDERYIVLTDIA